MTPLACAATSPYGRGLHLGPWKRVCLAHRRQCAFCNRFRGVSGLAITYAVPLGQGGEDDERNIVPICCDCAGNGSSELHPTHAAIFADRQAMS